MEELKELKTKVKLEFLSYVEEILNSNSPLSLSEEILNEFDLSKLPIKNYLQKFEFFQEIKDEIKKELTEKAIANVEKELEKYNTIAYVFIVELSDNPISYEPVCKLFSKSALSDKDILDKLADKGIYLSPLPNNLFYQTLILNKDNYKEKLTNQFEYVLTTLKNNDNITIDDTYKLTTSRKPSL